MRALVACAVLLPSLASAEETPGASHHKQFQLSARLAFGLRGIVTYDEEYCGDTDTSRPSGFGVSELSAGTASPALAHANSSTNIPTKRRTLRG